MAVGVDRVQVYKDESSAGGGNPADVGPYGGPVPLDPQQDAVETAGVFFQDEVDRDELVCAFRDSGQLRFKDTVTPEVTLADLASGALPPPQEPCVFLFSEDGITWKQIVLLTGRRGVLVNRAGEILYKG